MSMKDTLRDRDHALQGFAGQTLPEATPDAISRADPPRNPDSSPRIKLLRHHIGADSGALIQLLRRDIGRFDPRSGNRTGYSHQLL